MTGVRVGNLTPLPLRGQSRNSDPNCAAAWLISELPRILLGNPWRATTRWPRFILGLAVAVLFVVPILNLLAPILGAAMATHLFHEKGRS